MLFGTFFLKISLTKYRGEAKQCLGRILNSDIARSVLAKLAGFLLWRGELGAREVICLHPTQESFLPSRKGAQEKGGKGVDT